MNEVLVKIHAEKRFKTGTGNSREFRSNKLIPGIIYGVIYSYKKTTRSEDLAALLC